MTDMTEEAFFQEVAYVGSSALPPTVLAAIANPNALDSAKVITDYLDPTIRRLVRNEMQQDEFKRRFNEDDAEKIEPELVRTTERDIINLLSTSMYDLSITDVIWTYQGCDDDGPIVGFTPEVQRRLDKGESLESIEATSRLFILSLSLSPQVSVSVAYVRDQEEKRIQREISGTCTPFKLVFGYPLESSINTTAPEVSKACADDTQWYEVDHNMELSEDRRRPDSDLEIPYIHDTPAEYTPRRYSLFDVCRDNPERTILDLKLHNYTNQRIAYVLGWTQTNARNKVSKIYDAIVKRAPIHEHHLHTFGPLDVEWLMERIRAVPNISRITAGRRQYKTPDELEPHLLLIMQRNGKIAVVDDVNRDIFAIRFYDGQLVPFGEKNWANYRKKQYRGYTFHSW